MSYPFPPPTSSISVDERRWGAAAHVGALVAAWFALGILGPIAVLVLKGNESAFVRRHAVESLNFQISLLICIAVATLSALLTLGLALTIILPIGFLVAVFALIEIILATAAANRGEAFRYPVNLRLVH